MNYAFLVCIFISVLIKVHKQMLKAYIHVHIHQYNTHRRCVYISKCSKSVKKLKIK